MKLAVVYTSKYGSTKQYAGWIAEAQPDIFFGTPSSHDTGH